MTNQAQQLNSYPTPSMFIGGVVAPPPPQPRVISLVDCGDPGTNQTYLETGVSTDNFFGMVDPGYHIYFSTGDGKFIIDYDDGGFPTTAWEQNGTFPVDWIGNGNLSDPPPIGSYVLPP